ncbi:hypothetical protein EON73_00290 [bacterium]|nr:MAG: hypothetical protein EON73_00290 [bacterium]
MTTKGSTKGNRKKFELDDNSNHFDGVNALFTPSEEKEKQQKEKKGDTTISEESELTGFHMMIRKDWLTELKMVSAKRRVPMKDLVLMAIAKEYGFKE